MKEEDLIRLMDAYMGCEGYYMKPKIEEGGKLPKLNVQFVQMFLI